MGKTIKIVLIAGVTGVFGYCAYTGVTLNDAGQWLERNLGIRAKKPDLKGVPYHNYTPAVGS